MPTNNDVERRDRALVAFALLTGARDNAIASMSLRHVDLGRREVFQDGRDVRTKNRKTIVSFFFPVGAEVEKIVFDWIGFLASERLFVSTDPLFPATRVEPGKDRLFRPTGLTKTHWKDAKPIRRIFRDAFAAANLPYCNPHSFRKTLAALGQTVCITPEQLKAWSQNLGHDHVLTTFTSYGSVQPERQAEIISALATEAGKPVAKSDAIDLEALHQQLARIEARISQQSA
jgi:integrase